MKALYLIACLLVCGINSATAATNITSSTFPDTWTAEGSPYYVYTNIVISHNKKLVIEPGVEVIFMDYLEINVKSGGVLRAIGTPKAPITFRINDTTGWSNPAEKSGAWKGFRFEKWTASGLDSSTLQYCNISDTKQGGTFFGKASYGFSIQRGLFLKNCNFTHHHGITSSHFMFINSEDATVTIDSCLFADNTMHYAVLKIQGKPTQPHQIQRSVFRNNVGYGAVIWVTFGSADIEACELYENQGTSSLGAITVYGDVANIRHCKIHHNITQSQAAIHSLHAVMDIDNNYIYNNTHLSGGCSSAQGGGAIRIQRNGNSSFPHYYRIRNNVIANNYSPFKGGGITAYNCKAIIANNTIVNNKSIHGGGIVLEGALADIDMLNNIFYGNENHEACTGLYKSGDVYLMSPVLLKMNHNWMETPLNEGVILASGTPATITGDTSHHMYGINPDFISPTAGAVLS